MSAPGGRPGYWHRARRELVRAEQFQARHRVENFLPLPQVQERRGAAAEKDGSGF